jgi:hypothetical protein
VFGVRLAFVLLSVSVRLTFVSRLLCVYAPLLRFLFVCCYTTPIPSKCTGKSSFFRFVFCVRFALLFYVCFAFARACFGLIFVALPRRFLQNVLVRRRFAVAFFITCRLVLQF